MANQDFEEDNPFTMDPAHAAYNWQQQALIDGMNGIDGDPEKAARSLQISRSTGMPATSLYNQEDPDRELKTTLVGNFIRNNPVIRDYVASHPLGATVMGDDYGKVDFFTDLLGRFNQRTAAETAVQYFVDALPKRPLLPAPPKTLE